MASIPADTLAMSRSGAARSARCLALPTRLMPTVLLLPSLLFLAVFFALPALGLVSLVGVPGQIIFGDISDRIGREWVWTFGCAGFVICFVALIALQAGPTPWLLYTMVLAQGFLGYSLTSVLGPIVAEIFEGPHFGTIFGTVMLAAVTGGAAGPWVTGVLYDRLGHYTAGFWLALAMCFVSAAAIWLAGPRKVRLVAGRAGKTAR